MRAAMDALFYPLRTGCPWRDLPRDGRFPPRGTVYYQRPLTLTCDQAARPLVCLCFGA